MCDEMVSDIKGNPICESNLLCVGTSCNATKLLCKLSTIQEISEDVQTKCKSDKECGCITDGKDGTNKAYMNKVLLDMNSQTFCKTNILNECNFMSKTDKYIFDSLPLTNSQKEELLLSIYKRV
jgi:hypothetical protein